MKLIWTLLFLAIAAAIFGIAWLLIPESARGERFWLSMAGIGMGLLLVYVSLAFAPGSRGEQGGSVMTLQMTGGSITYLCLTCILAAVAALHIPYKLLVALHIIALLVWVIMVALGALGSRAMRGADRS